MVDLSEYSSDKLMKMNEPQLKQALEKYKKEQMPLWKIGVVVGYHGFALAGMYYYAMKLRGKRVEPSFKNRHQLTVINMFRKGSVHAVLSSLFSCLWYHCMLQVWLWYATTISVFLRSENSRRFKLLMMLLVWDSIHHTNSTCCSLVCASSTFLRIWLAKLGKNWILKRSASLKKEAYFQKQYRRSNIVRKYTKTEQIKSGDIFIYLGYKCLEKKVIHRPSTIFWWASCWSSAQSISKEKMTQWTTKWETLAAVWVSKYTTRFAWGEE